jgi:hypothetical protein
MAKLIKKVKKNEKPSKLDEILNFSMAYEVIKGGFGDPRDKLVTYKAKVNISEAHVSKDFQFFETVSSDKAWPISKIIQREIEEERVDEISSDYIESKKSVKYFPPITVVLLPKGAKDSLSDTYSYLGESTQNLDSEAINFIYNNSKGWKENDSYDDELKEFIRKKELIDAEQISDIKGVYVLRPYDWINYQILTWDKDQYYAIVIDGQHRLSALYHSLTEGDVDVKNYLLDVVFIDISMTAKIHNLTPPQVVRNIFIDINTTPKEVNIARGILMDDLGLSNKLVQTLVNDDDSDKKRLGKYLLPQMIDWHTFDFKHELPYLTNILTLQEIIANYFLSGVEVNLSKTLDRKNTHLVNKWCKTLNETLKVDDLILKDKEWSSVKQLSISLDEYLSNIPDDDNDDSDSDGGNDTYYFNYDVNILKVAAKSFENNYCKSLVYLFESIVPNNEIIQNLKSLGAFDNTKNYSSSLTKSSKKRIEIPEIELFKTSKALLEEQFKDKYFLLNTVAGQKAIFKNYFQYIFSKINGKVGEAYIFELTKKYVEIYNLFMNLLMVEEITIFGDRESLKNDYKKVIKDAKYLTGNVATIEIFFLDGIIYSRNGQILYKKEGVNALSSLISIFFNFAEKNEKFLNKTSNDYIDIPSNAIAEISGIQKSLLRVVKSAGLLVDVEEEKDAVNLIIEARNKYLNDYLRKLSNKFRGDSNEKPEKNTVLKKRAVKKAIAKKRK